MDDMAQRNRLSSIVFRLDQCRLKHHGCYYTRKQKPLYQRSGKAACQPGASRQAKLNQTQGPAVGAARIVPRV
jgi:hypothetical protein